MYDYNKLFSKMDENLTCDHNIKVVFELPDDERIALVIDRGIYTEWMIFLLNEATEIE